MLELVGLCLVDAVGEIGEIATAVDHALVEKEAVKAVRDVVMVLDRLLARAADEGVVSCELVGGPRISRKGKRGQVTRQLQLGQRPELGLQLAFGAQRD